MIRNLASVLCLRFAICQYLVWTIAALSETSIHCRPSCDGKDNAMQVGAPRAVRCYAEHIRSTPWARSKDLTAPRPEDLQVKWYNYNKTKIALDISWKQKWADLDSNEVRGYFLQYSMQKMRLNLTTERVNSTAQSAEKSIYLRFHYTCAGATGRRIIRTGDSITVKVRSLPMHRLNHWPQLLSTTIKITKDTKRQISTAMTPVTSVTTTVTPMTSVTTTMTQPASLWKGTFAAYTQKPDYTRHYILVSVGSALFIVVMLALMAYKAQKTNKAPKRILMITSFHDNCEDEHMIATRMRNNYGLDITCNWENQTEITKNSLDWYRDAMMKTDAVVFVMKRETFLSQFGTRDHQRLESPEMLQALNVAQTSKQKINIEFVILVVGSVHKVRSSWWRQTTQYTVYDTSHSFWKFVQHMTGTKIARTLDLEKLREMRASENAGIDDEHDENHLAFENEPTENDDKGISIESVASLYENVDVKEELLSASRNYHKEGARPKIVGKSPKDKKVIQPNLEGET